MERSMIIVAGGSGTRMGAEIPKQFLLLNGRPILMHTLQNLCSIDPKLELILVLPEDQIENWKELCRSYSFKVDHKLTAGGSSRFLSVRNGLQLAGDSALIGIHDGVRPFVTARLIEDCFCEAKKSGAAVPVSELTQSLRMINGLENKSADRSKFRQVQTPQCFQTEVLRTAFENADGTDFSDDATVVEASGKKISLVQGEQENIKITTPFDLEIAELINARRMSRG